MVALDATPAELEIARAEIDAAHLEARVIDPEAPGGELGAIREVLALALGKARELFVATRYDEARALIDKMESDPRAARWAGEPRVATALGELLLVAAQCGDAQAVRRAAERFPGLTLDPARWNPEVRMGYEKARAADAPHRRPVELSSDPPGALVFVDGVPLGRTPAHANVSRGRHAVFMVREGRAPTVFELGDGAPSAKAPLAPLKPEDRRGALRLLVDSGAIPEGEELDRSATELDLDALAVIRLAGGVAAAVAGRGVAPLTIAPRAGDARDRPRALREAVAAIARHVRGECALTHTPPERARAGQRLDLDARGGPCLARLRGEGRVSTKTAWTPIEPRDGKSALALALPSSEQPYVLEYRLWGETAGGRVAESLGSTTSPLRVPVEADRSPPHWYKKWWVWTIAVAVVAGAAVGAGFLFYKPATEVRVGGGP